MNKYLATHRRTMLFHLFPRSASALGRAKGCIRTLFFCIVLFCSSASFAQSLSEADQASFADAIANQSIDTIATLLDKGASTNTLMFGALNSLNMDMLNLALNAGADISTNDSEGNNALHVLSNMKFTQAAKLRSDKKLSDEQISEHIKLRATRLDMVDLLVSKGADVNALSETGETPISLAFGANQALLVDYFIAKKADPSIGPNLFQKEGAHLFDTNYLKNMLDSGYKATPGQNDTTTPLHLLTKHSSDKTKMALFIEYGADVNATDSNGNTPLSASVSSSNANQNKAREALISLGAKVPANYEQLRQLSALSKLIDERDHVAVLQLITQHPQTVNKADPDGLTPLMRASQGSLKITRLLLDNEADLNLQVNGKNAHDTAVASGHDYIARYLIKQGIQNNTVK